MKRIRCLFFVFLFSLFVAPGWGLGADKTLPASPSGAAKPASIFQRAKSPVTWKNITQPFRDLDQHIADSMGWTRGFRDELEAGLERYFSADGLVSLFESLVQAIVTIILAIFLWRMLASGLNQASVSVAAKTHASVLIRWAQGGIKFARSALFWGLVAFSGALIIGFFVVKEPILVFVISILISIALFQIGHSALTILLNPDSPDDRLLRFRDEGAAHLFRYFNRMIFFAAVWWPVIQFFDAIDYHNEFEDLLWVIFRLAIFIFSILLVSNKQIIIRSIPSTEMGKQISQKLHAVFPVLIGMIVGVFALYTLGFIRLAQFVMVSLLYSAVLLGVAVGLVRWLGRIRRAPVVSVSPEAQILPISPDQQQRLRGVIFSFAIALVWILFGSTVFWIWGFDFKLIEAATRPFSITLFTIGDTQVSLWVLTQMGLVLLLALLASRSIRLFLNRRVLPHSQLELATKHTLLSVLNYFIFTVGVIIALQTVGIDLTSFTLFAGVIGVGIGFGLQNIANNFISGIILLIERSLKVGDFVDVAGTLGTVEHVGARFTVVNTKDNIAVLVPNSYFITERVVNWSHGSTLTRLHLKVGVAYGSDTKLVEKTLIEAGKAHPSVVANPPPRVLFTGFQDSALGFELLVWTNQPDQNVYILSDLNFAVDQAFRENQITIPFPQRDLHLRSSAVPVKLDEDETVHQDTSSGA